MNTSFLPRLIVVALTGLSAMTIGCSEQTTGPVGPTNPTSEVTSITSQPDNASLRIGESIRVYASVDVTGDAETDVRFESRDMGIVQVNQFGVVTAIAEGTARVFAISEFDPSMTAMTRVTVSAQEDDPPLASIDQVVIGSAPSSLYTGTTVQLEFGVAHTGNIDTSLRWSSGRTDIATVDASGAVTGHREGTVVIEARSRADASKYAQTTLHVNLSHVTSVRITGVPSAIVPGDIFQLGARVSGRGAYDEFVLWNTSNRSVAHVTNGEVTVMGTGVVTIEAVSHSDRSIRDTVTLTIYQFDTSYYYRVTNRATEGEGRALGALPAGIKMWGGGDSPASWWKLTPVGGGRFRLTNSLYGGGKSLDHNAGSPHVFMGDSGNYTGQAWLLTPFGGGYYRLTSETTGEAYSLDTVGNEVVMMPSSSGSGQRWKLSKLHQH